MDDRAPKTYDFNDREAMLMRQAYHKPNNVGQFISGRDNVASAQRLADAGLITMVPAMTTTHREKLLIKPTRLGREAWVNQGLRAAGRPLTRLT